MPSRGKFRCRPSANGWQKKGSQFLADDFCCSLRCVCAQQSLLGLLVRCNRRRDSGCVPPDETSGSSVGTGAVLEGGWCWQEGGGGLRMVRRTICFLSGDWLGACAPPRRCLNLLLTAVCVTVAGMHGYGIHERQRTRQPLEQTQPPSRPPPLASGIPAPPPPPCLGVSGQQRVGLSRAERGRRIAAEVGGMERAGAAATHRCSHVLLLRLLLLRAGRAALRDDEHERHVQEVGWGRPSGGA